MPERYEVLDWQRAEAPSAQLLQRALAHFRRMGGVAGPPPAPRHVPWPGVMRRVRMALGTLCCPRAPRARVLARLAVLAASAALLVLFACDRAADLPTPEEHPAGDAEPRARIEFDTTTAYLLTRTDTVVLRVEIAERQDQRSFGLMDRDSLSADAGMVFLYDEVQPPESAFYMYRTRIPLDIAFFDGAGRIVSILHMTPCREADPVRCARYSPGVPHVGALEVNLGELQRRGVQLGDRLVIAGRIGS